ncbi:AAA family ATPase [Thiocapsa imhoffii]|uniref:AAA family ATPase n=1 Tax=Thiocapsa imhoffii TaxID=382777 RepID=A0A9X0WLA3_9GAMM|nr:sigma-54 dependent transcriptional regulator [Thiocapsa imhoffii]MBK1646718.1 AAA family ATPase [Thiocapsa imhoffii]
MNILVSWVGQTDLDAAAGEVKAGIGPIGQALTKRAYDLVVLLNNYPEAKCSHFLPWAKTLTEAEIQLHRARLTSPTDFGEIYKAATSQVAAIMEAHGENAQLTFHLSPGTSAMAAVWIILAKTRFAAELIESSIEQGVRTVAIPFDLSADFIPDLLRRPDAELTRLTAGLPPAAPAFGAIVHQSQVMQRVIARARRVALRSIPVLIEGESGTGKELLARAIHQASPRRDQPIITVNCGAIAPELIESELFGHEKGAFTGAASARQGVFEAAHRGTLFLDEVGELPKSAQVRFLRALQEGEITRVGANQAIGVDVRIIAATNRNLSQEVSEGRFREDLFYRLAVAVILLPPLRERDGDTSLLLDRLLDQVNRECATEPGFEPKKLSVNARKVLLDHPWPGNVRELLNTLRRAAVWTPESLIDADDARDALLPGPGQEVREDPILSRDVRHGLDLTGVIEQVARHYLAQAMQVTGNNKARAAKLLGFGNATTLTNWLKRYGVRV